MSFWKSVRDAGSAIAKGLGSLLGVAVSPAAAAIANTWALGVIAANEGRFKQLPANVRGRLREHYRIGNATIRAFDIDDVRYGESCSGVPDDAAAITFGNFILFKGNVDFSNRPDLQLLIHELEHCQQYHIRGGLYPFLVVYCAQAGLHISELGSFKIHDHIELERDATAKEALINSVWP